MRIVQFTNASRVVNYPQEGISAFGHTERIGDLIVGEYKGSASASDLPNYTGTWPLPPSAEALAKQGRSWRDNELELSDTDPEHLPDHPKHNTWKAWRTALRDWPTTSEFPDTKPTKGY